MGCNKIKSALFKYLKSFDEPSWQRLERVTKSHGHQTIAGAILEAVCHKRISNQSYRWLTVKNGEIHIFYGGTIRNKTIFSYGHLVISCKDKLIINVHRRPFSNPNKAYKIPEPELLRLEALKA